MQIDDSRVVPLTLLAQAGSSLITAAVAWLGFGEVAAASVLLGGAAAVVPNAFLAARLLSPAAGASARALLRSAWVGEIGKLLLTVLAFGTIFAFVRPLAPLAVFCGFIAAQAAMIAGAFCDGNRWTEANLKS